MLQESVPIGSILVPVEITLLDPKYEPQKGTTLEPLGSGFRVLRASGRDWAPKRIGC